MKKIASLSLVLLMALASRSQAQTSYLVDLYEPSGGTYTGNASKDFKILGNVVNVGYLATAGEKGATRLYQLGTLGTLTLAAPYLTYDFNGSKQYRNPRGSLTNPQQLTGSYIVAGAQTAYSPVFTLDLTDLPAGATVSISAIGTDNGNSSAVVSVDGGAGVILNQAATNGTGTFTSLLTGGTKKSYTIKATTPNTPYPGAEGDITAILVTISEAH